MASAYVGAGITNALLGVITHEYLHLKILTGNLARAQMALGIVEPKRHAQSSF